MTWFKRDKDILWDNKDRNLAFLRKLPQSLMIINHLNEIILYLEINYKLYHLTILL